MRDRLRGLLGSLGTTGRLGVLAVLVLAVAVAGSATGAGDGLPTADRDAPGAGPAAPATVVVDPQGRPLRGKDGKPLRLSADGTKVVDSAGRLARDRRGRPLRVRPGGRPSPGARRGGRPRGKERARRPGTPRRGRPRRGPGSGGASAAGQAPFVVGAVYADHEAIEDWGEKLSNIHATAADPAPMLGALRAHVNATGGIGGRRLHLEGHELQGGRPDEATNRMCTHFAEGLRPSVVIGMRLRPPKAVPCLAPRGVVLVDDWPSAQPAGFFAQHPDHYFAPGGAEVGRLSETYVAGLQRAGFFAPGGKPVNVGMLTVGGAEAAFGPALKAALRRAGYPPKSEAQVGSNDSTPGSVLAEARSAAMEFKFDEVTHVVGFDAAGLAIMTFMQTAAKQLYQPRYGLNSTHAPLTITAQITHVDQVDKQSFRDQLRGGGGAVGVGWSPLFDVDQSQEPPSPTAAACRGIYARAGVRIGDRSWFGEYTALALCDMVLALREAVARSGGTSPAALRAGFEALGTSWPSAVNLATRLDGSRHDGADGFRLLRYDDGCTCMRYEGPTFAG